MPQISRNKLKPKIKKNITDQLVITIADLDRKSARVFFDHFFSDTEKVMFAKRLSIIYLLREGLSPYRVSQLLKVSHATVRLYEERYTPTEMEAIIKSCKGIGSGAGIFEELKLLLLEGYSTDPRKRAKWLNEFEARHGK